MQSENLIERFIGPGELVILAAPPKTGKTAIASAMALAIAKGAPFAYTPTSKAPVLWLALEESRAERAAIMHAAKGRQRTPLYTVFEDIRPDTTRGMARLQHLCLLHEPKLIVIDPLFAAQSTRSNSQTLAALADIAHETGAAILVLHHLRAWHTHAEVTDLMRYATAVWSLDYRQLRRYRIVTLRREARKLISPSNRQRVARSTENVCRGLGIGTSHQPEAKVPKSPKGGWVPRSDLPIHENMTAAEQANMAVNSRQHLPLDTENVCRGLGVDTSHQPEAKVPKSPKGEPVNRTVNSRHDLQTATDNVCRCLGIDTSHQPEAKVPKSPMPRPTTLAYLSKKPLHYKPMPEFNPFTCTSEILSLLRDYAFLSSRQIATLVGITHGATRNTIAHLKQRGAILIHHRSSRTTYYKLGGTETH